MSEFQFVHFLALDKPLTDEQLEYMERQSSRAEITPHEFSNSYHYGDFRGNAAEMLRRGYDVHLHYANYGVRRLMFRLPAGLPWKKLLFKAFLPEYGVKWIADKSGHGGSLEISPSGEADEWSELYDDDLSKVLGKIAPMRERLMAGDLRPLYLAWLACPSEPEAIEPPVPAGLNQLPPDLERLADFYELGEDLLAAAAQPSPPVVETDRADAVRQWIASQPLDALQELVAGLLGDEPAEARSSAQAAMRENQDSGEWPVVKSGRSLGELQELASGKSIVRKQLETVKQQAQRAARLSKLAKAPADAIRQAGELAEQRTYKSYREAASLLADLREALGPEDGPRIAQAAANDLKAALPRKAQFAGALREFGLIPPKQA